MTPRSVELYSKYKLPLFEKNKKNLQILLNTAQQFFPGNHSVNYRSSYIRSAITPVLKFNGFTHNEIIKLYGLKSRRIVTYYLDYFFFLQKFDKFFKNTFEQFVDELNTLFYNQQQNISA